MARQKRPVALLAALAVLAFVSGCERPTHDRIKLAAIEAEAQMLMKASVDANVDKARWPRTIASLEPEFVMINPDGVHITTRAYSMVAGGISCRGKSETYRNL